MPNTNNTPISREEQVEVVTRWIRDDFGVRMEFSVDAGESWWCRRDFKQPQQLLQKELDERLKAFADEVERELPDKQFCSISRGCKHRWNDIEEKHMEYVKGFNRARKESVSALKDLKEKWGIDG